MIRRSASTAEMFLICSCIRDSGAGPMNCEEVKHG